MKLTYKFSWIFLCNLIVCSFFTKAQSQTTVTFQPDATAGIDALIQYYINGATNTTNTNYGNSSSIGAWMWTSGAVPFTNRSFVKFDLTSIPTNAIVVSANLTLYGINHNPYTQSNASYFQRVTSSWDENAITWNNQPSTTTTAQISLAQSSSATQNYILDVKTHLQDMISNPQNNYGWMLRLQSEVNYYAALNFASSDYATASQHPKLEVSYIEPNNSTSTKTFDGNGNVTSESKVYLDDIGRETQSQKSLLSDNDVLASQTIYDAYGRPALRTLPAPIGQSYIAFKNNFVNDAGNSVYSFANFDTPAKLNSPDPLNNTVAGTPGNYYSNSNSSEPYVATSAYPYIRTEFTADPAGIPKRAARAGDEYRMGAGHETKTYSMVSGDELKYIFGTNKSYKSYKDNADNLVNSPYTITGGIVAEKTITVDADGKEMISYICNGLPIASCYSGLAAPCTMTTVTNTMNYYGTKSTDIHLPAASKLTLRLPLPNYMNHFQTPSTILPSEITYKITDLNTNQLLVQGTDYSINTNGNVAFLGNYLTSYTSARVFRISFDYTSAFLCYSTDSYGKCLPNAWLNYIPDATVTYDLDYSQWTLNYYDLAGNLRKSVSPLGINCANPGTITMASTYDYSSKGELIAEKSPDEGKKEFLYDTEGKLRFSQNEVQKTSDKMAYTNYDKHGRAVESGEYTTNATGVYFQNYYGTYTPPAVCSACTSAATILNALDGLTDAQCSDASYVAYYQLPGALEIPSAYSYKSSYTQKYLLNKVSKTWNSESATWYSYDASGKNTFTVQQILDAGFASQAVNDQIKTIDYVYDLPTGLLAQQIYQKNKPTEKLTHIFTYDADQRLLTSSIRESADVSDRLQAKYFYYKTGALKRKELGDKLQGIDYVYTINGELKSINHPSSDEFTDPGKDGYGASVFGKDIFGMTLDYHANDYTRAGSHIVSSTDVASPGFYNGLIQAQRYKTRAIINGVDNLADYIAYGTGDQVKIINGVNDEIMNRYTYDELYRLSTSTFGGFNNSNNTFTASLAGNYKEFGASSANGISYDANGNIKSLKRNAYSGVTGLRMDDLTYTYTASTNKLASIIDAATSSYGTDFDAATSKTFSYNTLGQMTASQAEGVSNIQYNVRKNVKSMNVGSPLVEYFYNDRGIKQRTKYNTPAKSTWYISDVSGNVMAIYEQDLLSSATIILKDQPIYGAGRLGVLDKTTGVIKYELTDHLGNVRAAISDRKIVVPPATSNELTGIYHSSPWEVSNSNEYLPTASYRFGNGYLPIGNYSITFDLVAASDMTVKFRIWDVDDYWILLKEESYIIGTESSTRTINFSTTSPAILLQCYSTNGGTFYINNIKDAPPQVSYTADVLSYSDYYAFGGVMPGRSYGNAYRYNYQGQENAVNSRMDNFDLRMLSTDLGRWISPDPAGQFASPYISMGNNPVSGVDPDGGYIYDITGDQYNHQYWTNENFVRNAEWQRENLKRDFDSAKISWLDYFNALITLWRENGLSMGGNDDGPRQDPLDDMIWLPTTNSLGSAFIVREANGNEHMSYTMEGATKLNNKYNPAPIFAGITLPAVTIEEAASQLHRVVQYTLDNLNVFANKNLSNMSWGQLHFDAVYNNNQRSPYPQSGKAKAVYPETNFIGPGLKIGVGASLIWAGTTKVSKSAMGWGILKGASEGTLMSTSVIGKGLHMFGGNPTLRSLTFGTVGKLPTIYGPASSLGSFLGRNSPLFGVGLIGWGAYDIYGN